MEAQSSSHPLRRLLSYAAEFRGNMILATLFSILNKLFDLAPPVLIGAAVDIAVRRETSVFGEFGITDLTAQLYVLAGLTMFVWIMESVFEYTYKIYWRNLAQAVEHKLRMDVYRHIQDLEMEFFADQQTGGLMAILNDDVNQLERFLDNGANSIIQVLTTVTAISAAFFVLSPRIGMIGFIPIPLIIYFSVKFQGLLEPKYKSVREKVGILNGRLSNNLSGISTIKSYTSEEYEAERISEASDAYQQVNRDAIVLSSAFSPLVRMIIMSGFIAMLVVGGQLTLNNELEVAAYSIIIFLIQRLLWPLTSIAETFDQYQRAMASTNRALDLLDTHSKIQSGEQPLPLTHVKGKLELRDIEFGYKTRGRILQDFNVLIKPSQTIAFVGATGAGKSTIVKLLLRFYDPQEGKILFDDKDIRDLNLSDLRSAIALVSQETFILDGSIKENIAYGKPEASMDEIIAAASIAEIHDFVATLPDGYATLVGERGQKLSGGQRQRISIARAVLKNPPVMIFDEATSSVDNETEEAIQRSLEKIIVGRTTILIAHRLSTIRNADRIFVLENGRIIEEGTHDQLVEMNGQYSYLWKVQTGEKLLKVQDL